MSPAERDRAARFLVASSRRRYVVARSLLRILLGRYLGRHPAEVALTAGPFGKPRLADSLTALHFNLSHSDDLAVYAFAREREVGVDLERIQKVAEWQDIAASFFDESEAATLRTLDETQRDSAFIGAWTRHEASLKVPGQGLGGPRPEDSATVSFCPIEPPAGFAAALAVEGPPAIVLDQGFI